MLKWTKTHRLTLAQALFAENAITPLSVEPRSGKECRKFLETPTRSPGESTTWRSCTAVYGGPLRLRERPDALQPIDNNNGAERCIKATQLRCSGLVRDHGPGIEPSDLPRLFEKLSRVGNTEQHAVPGYGLGLDVSKAMVEAQRGHMWVCSDPGRGSTFVYMLPSAKPGEG